MVNCCSLYRSNAGESEGMISPSSDVRAFTSVPHVSVNSSCSGLGFGWLGMWGSHGIRGKGRITGNDIGDLE